MTTKMNKKPTFQTLLLDCVLEIFKYVPLPECMYLRSSCSQLKHAVDEHIKVKISRFLAFREDRDSYLQLCQSGGFQQMIQLLHEHTFEWHYQSEENTHIESFLEDFNRKSEQRQRLSSKIREIINSSANASKRLNLKIFDFLQTLRDYTERLYSFLTDLKSNSENFIPEVKSPFNDDFRMFLDETKEWKYSEDCSSFCLISERFGCVYVILDLIRAQRRFAVKFPDQANYSLMEACFKFLVNICDGYDEWGIKHFRVKSRWLNKLLVDILEDAKDNYSDYLSLVRTCTILIDNLYFSLKPEVIIRRFPYIISCGVIKSLTQLAVDIEHPHTRHCILQALDTLFDQNLVNVQEFCSIDGSIDMLIDVLTTCEKNEDSFKYWKKVRRNFSGSILYSIHELLIVNKPIDDAGRQYLAIYESREIGDVLANLINRITHDRYIGRMYDETTRKLVGLLGLVLRCSLDQRLMFLCVDGALEAVERFANSNDPDMVKEAKKVLELL